MKKTERNTVLETMCDNYEQAAQRKEALYTLLDKMETMELTQEEYERICAQAQEQIRQLKQEREQMIVYVARESTFVDEAETRLKEICRVRRSRKRLIKPAPTNAQIDAQERRIRHFAQGRSFYKLFWVFFIGCFAGVMIERLWTLIRYGVLEPRVGLIYGPFNLVYGLGAWALTAALYPLRNRTGLLSFLGGVLIGSAVEYGCAFFQEMVFGSVSWDYSNRPFNLHGRICLLYSVYWGVLGLLWIKELYPRMARWILKIPNRVGKPLTLLLCAFMVFNTLMTGACVMRWAQRHEGRKANNRVEAYFDEHYPDDKMERIFSNLKFMD